MTYIKIKRDFNNGEKCGFCKRKLKSFTGTLLIEKESGRQVWAGDRCTQLNAENAHEQIPDLVKASYEIEPKDDEDDDINAVRAPRTNNSISNAINQPSNEDALSYLILRQEKLKHIKGVSYSKFEPLYERYNANTLTEEDLLYLKNTIKKNSATNNEFSLKRFRNIYACEASLKRCLGIKPESVFFNNLSNYLHANKKLTDKQIIRMNEELDKVKFKHKISPDAFK